MARSPSPRAEADRRGTGAPRRRRWDEDGPAPWLDEAEPEPEERTLIGRRTFWGLILGLLLLIALVVAGILLVAPRADGPIDIPAPGEEVPLLTAPGPWKLRPTGPETDGVPVEGQGQVLFGTGDGREPDARIAVEALPEEPLPLPGAQVAAVPEALPPPGAAAPLPPAAAAGRPGAAAPPPPAPPRPAGPKVVEVPGAAAPPLPAAVPGPAAGGGTVLQLGAFSSEGRARAAFKAMAERFPYLAGLEPRILPVSAEGRTLYRLRVDAGDPARAADICGRLRVAGEACGPVD